jgi:hypothetical protein
MTERAPLTAAQRRMRSSLASLTRWANEDDPAAAMRPALNGFLTKFEREVDPDGTLDPEERTRRAQAARKAHMRRLALASSRKRAARKTAQPEPERAA